LVLLGDPGFLGGLLLGKDSLTGGDKSVLGGELACMGFFEQFFLFCSSEQNSEGSLCCLLLLLLCLPAIHLLLRSNGKSDLCGLGLFLLLLLRRQLSLVLLVGLHECICGCFLSSLR
jgi:hypothetical protein